MEIRNTTPLVSVLMTAYNREQYIGEAIESVLKNDYPNFELIVLDDCSQDKTYKIVNEFAKKDSRIRLIKNEKNLGQFPNRNKITEYATGDLLMFVDSDDTIEPDSISYVASVFSKFPNAEFSLLYYGKKYSEPTLISKSDAVKQHFFEQSFLNIGPGGTIITKNLFNKIKGFPTIYGAPGDMFYNLKAAYNADVLLLPYIYLNYRVHAGQEKNNAFQYLCFSHRYLSDALSLPENNLSENEKKIILRKSARGNLKGFAKYLLTTGNIKKTLEAYRKSGLKISQLF